MFAIRYMVNYFLLLNIFKKLNEFNCIEQIYKRF